MIVQLAASASELETRGDVKCWTSFKQLETFVAGGQLAPGTTHLKTEVVMSYLDRIWARAADATDAGEAVSSDTFERVADSVVPYELAGLTEKAEDRYQNLIENHPENFWAPESLYRLNDIYTTNGNNQQASRYSEILLSHFPRNRWTQKGLKEKQVIK